MVVSSPDKDLVSRRERERIDLVLELDNSNIQTGTIFIAENLYLLLLFYFLKLYFLQTPSIASFPNEETKF